MTPSKARSEPSLKALVTVEITDVPPAANDDAKPKIENDLRNPLWIIAIGMAWFFGITAAVIALS